MLASDFPRLWQDPRTPDREKKRMVRLLLEDVTLLKRAQISVHVRFKGGATESFLLPLPVGAPILRKTPAAVVREIDWLLDQHTEAQVATMLNDRGVRSATGTRSLLWRSSSLVPAMGPEPIQSPALRFGRLSQVNQKVTPICACHTLGVTTCVPLKVERKL